MSPGENLNLKTTGVLKMSGLYIMCRQSRSDIVQDPIQRIIEEEFSPSFPISELNAGEEALIFKEKIIWDVVLEGIQNYLSVYSINGSELLIFSLNLSQIKSRAKHFVIRLLVTVWSTKSETCCLNGS